MNITKFLQKREFSSSRPNLFKACSHQLFDMRVTHQISPFSSLLIQPSRVDSIVQVGDNCLVFILHQSGVCSVYNTQTKKGTHNSSTPSAVSTSIGYVKCGQPEAGFPIFASDIQLGGFLECDMLTGKALTC
ncbi:hypothetical protein QL285_041095 [Trifolium repens]|nr:hypothetical protein QL285_041095 [Trifolium repens]